MDWVEVQRIPCRPNPHEVYIHSYARCWHCCCSTIALGYSLTIASLSGSSLACNCTTATSRSLVVTCYGCWRCFCHSKRRPHSNPRAISSLNSQYWARSFPQDGPISDNTGWKATMEICCLCQRRQKPSLATLNYGHPCQETKKID